MAEIVQEAIHHRDKKEYDLIAYCIMPNHVHMVFSVDRLSESTVPDVGRNVIPTYISRQLFRILQSLKRYTAKNVNRLLHRTGPFWQHESYDHVVRDDSDLSRIVEYILMNPVSAGLVDSWDDWKWTYLKKL